MENAPIKLWLNRAIALLTASLEPPRHELNELDWKSEISTDKQRIAEHLSAFSNYPNGGFMIFGIDASGIPHGVNQSAIETTLNHLSNIGRHGLEPAVTIDHAVETHNSVRLLIVYISESPVKPVHLRGKSLECAFIRSGGTTRPASRQDVGMLMLHIYSGFTGSVRAVFGQDVDYATETKIFARPELFLPRRVTAIKRKRQIGEPDMEAATTCHAERTNLSLRTFTRRFTRCTLGYSKKLDNMKHAVALFVWHFNFCRVHSAHGRTPAREAGLVSQAFTIEDLLTSNL